MAGPASNFNDEIKKGMTSPKAKVSDGGVVSKTPVAGNKSNQWNQPPGPQGQDGVASGANGDTHAAMIAAGQAHMNSIHAHINAISSGKGAGSGVPVNQGTRVK